MMLVIHAVAGADPSLAWLLFALLVFVLVVAAVGAVVGARVLDGRAPGALPENEDPATRREKAEGE